MATTTTAERGGPGRGGIEGERKVMRFSATCKVCGKWLLIRQQAQYLKAGWSHVSVEDCAAAPPSLHSLPWATDAERDSQPFYQRLQRLAMIVRRQKWTVAKTMPQNPHAWAVRPDWQGDGFNDVVLATRQMGQIVKFGRTDYHILNLNEHRYWNMEARMAPPEVSDLINQGVRLRYEPCPEPWFDPSWAWWSDVVERFVVTQMTPDTARVLDVGGTCPSVARIAGAGYRAIGTPGDMTRLLGEVKTARTRHTEVEHFAPTSPEPFDLAVAAFGVGQRLTAREIRRLTYMTRGPVVVQVGTRVTVAEEVVALLGEPVARVGPMACFVVPGGWQA